MGVRIGVRRENKNRWERRVPLVPSDLAALQKEHGLRFVVQPSDVRIFEDSDYKAEGIAVDERMRGAGIVFGVKEIPTRLLREGKVYIYFAHVVKGQAYNMPMLARLMELGCSLIDYERIVDDANRRLVFFGRHAGQAGMIETLRALGLRLATKGVRTSLAEIKPAYEYRDLDDAKAHLHQIGERLAQELPDSLRPLVVGVTGYGNVSAGAQDVLAALPVESVPVQLLKDTALRRGAGSPLIAKVVFREEDMACPRDAGQSFELSDYYAHPERFEGCFAQHLDHLDVLVNAIYWEPRFPRLVTKEWVRARYVEGAAEPRLKVIGDISCDIDGSIEMTVKATEPDNPVFVWEPAEEKERDGVEGVGPVIMSVDNLPCELARESSMHFSSVLKTMVPDIAKADWQADFEKLALPSHLTKALIVHKGQLTPAYAYLAKSLAAAGAAKQTPERAPGVRAP